MSVWLLHIGEPLPSDGSKRLFRYGHLARALLASGHEVLRWAPNFCHARKTHRYPDDRRVSLERGYDVQFVHSPGYRSNTSLGRLQTYRILGRRFHELAAKESPPDAIVAAIPSLEWAEAAVDYGHAHGVPVVVDVRDLWPDVFPSAMPWWLRPAGRVLLAPYYRTVRRVCRKAHHLAAVSQTYLNWALRHAGREQRPGDIVAPLGFEPDPLPPEVLNEKVAELHSRGIDPGRPSCFFAGALERHHEIDTVIEAARLLQVGRLSDVQFVICGDGSKKAALQQQAAGLRGVHFLGWADGPTLQAVASISVVGLCAYAKGAMMSLGNKPYEYMAGQLAIVSSLPGELERLLIERRCGVTYQAGDAAALAIAIARTTEDRKNLQQMRANSFQTWLNNFRSRDIYAGFADHLSRLQPAAMRLAA